MTRSSSSGIDSLAFGGNGVARSTASSSSSARGLPGDTVRARVTKVQRRHAEAITTEVLDAGPDRVDAPCAHFPACGGCRFQDLAYEAQLAAKHAWVEDSLRRIAGSPSRRSSRSSRPRSSSTTATRWSTRSRRTPDGAGLGLHRAGRWDEVLEIENCHLTTELGNRIRNAFATGRARSGSQRYDQKTAKGYLRHLVVREGRNTGQALVQLVTHERERFDRERLIEVLTRLPEVRSIQWAINDTPPR